MHRDFASIRQSYIGKKTLVPAQQNRGLKRSLKNHRGKLQGVSWPVLSARYRIVGRKKIALPSVIKVTYCATAKEPKNKFIGSDANVLMSNDITQQRTIAPCHSRAPDSPGWPECRHPRRLGPGAVARNALLLAVLLATPLHAQDRRVVREPYARGHYRVGEVHLYVNRGIGGQTTPQMLVRMYPDVIDLKPAVMILLAGTNDIARNTGPMTSEMIQENISAMTELAQHLDLRTSDPEEWSDETVEDDRLRLIFTCCHPALAPEAQIALTLKAMRGSTQPRVKRDSNAGKIFQK